MLHDIPDEMKAYPQWVAMYFSYESLTGKIIAKARDFDNPSPRNKQWNTRFANKEVGFKNQGYIRVRLPNNKCLYAHQIAFLLMTGSIPEEIDHRDLNRTNNVWKNLRDCTHSENAANCFKRITNKSGFKGVCWNKSNKAWQMNIQFQHKTYFGYFSTKEGAYAAYCLKSAELHKEFGNVE